MLARFTAFGVNWAALTYHIIIDLQKRLYSGQGCNGLQDYFFIFGKIEPPRLSNK